ncbi:MAG: ThiF family adenylyltransferase, partial [Desulfurococcales archaeon]|nr:ThiF family adenylyltransferase [Desulfurococcales archaeon]
MKCPPPAKDPRYARQIPIIGEEGQEKLSKSKVAIVGLGGLGSITSQYLAAAGVGELIIIDSDVVEDNNLNRQL